MKAQAVERSMSLALFLIKNYNIKKKIQHDKKMRLSPTLETKI